MLIRFQYNSWANLMKMPANMSEDEVMVIIDKIAQRLAGRFIFGYNDIEDIKQQARLIALEGLESYDEGRPLENFLWVHVKNRLCNYKRNNYVRLDKPCDHCPFSAYDKSNDICTKFDNFLDCEIYATWFNKNESRKNIMNPIGLSCASSDKEENMKSGANPSEIISHKEIIDLIDKNIPNNLRSDWLQSKVGIRLPKPQRFRLFTAISEIFQENDIDVEKAWEA